MAEYQKVLSEWDRMCRNLDCTDCPIMAKGIALHVGCKEYIVDCPQEAECIIMKWAKEHPAMTNGKKFEEVFGFTPYMKFRSYEDMRQWIESEYEGND